MSPTKETAKQKIAQQERDSLRAMAPAFDIARPNIWRAPLIFASPHSGSIYPDSFLRRSTYSLNQLRANEDAFIERLFAPAAKIGAPLLAARFPRCFVDVNRAPHELPPSWGDDDKDVTPQAAAGYGVIPTQITPDIEIYKDPLTKVVARARLDALYYPYHRALADLISECCANFGGAIVIDCHSMPGFNEMGARRADIVLGDRYGQSCSPAVIDGVERTFTKRGYSVIRNHPYAGGFVTRHYGRSAHNPSSPVQTLQIEINRDLYLNPVTLRPKPKGYAKLSRDIHEIISTLIQIHIQAIAPALGANTLSAQKTEWAAE